MPQLTQATKNLISPYQRRYQSLKPKEGVSTVHVDEIASKIATFYEKIRMIVDWKEEHLMRRVAIIRKLKRRFLDWDLGESKIKMEEAESLVLELIRGGHFPNDRIEEAKIPEVQKVINKYLFIFKNKQEIKNPREKLQFYNWLLEIAACEIEETLASFRKERALIDYMFELMKERIRLKERIITVEGIKKEEKNIQIYIAVQQALFKLDHPIISYNLLKYKYPYWNNPAPEQLNEFAKNIYFIWGEVEKDLSHPLGKKFYTVCEKYDTPYLLLGDVLTKEGPAEVSEKISNPEVLEGLIRKSYKNRLSTLKARLFRAALYSTLSILLVNTFSVLILEIPVAKWIYGFFSKSPFLTISVDILGPTFLMFLLVATVRLPSKENLNLAVMETMKIVYQRETADVYEIKIPKKRRIITKSIIFLIYLFTALISFGFVYWVLKLAEFPITSIIINIMFVALIMSAGLAIRKRSEELTIEEKRSGVFAFFFDVFSLPVAGVGRWLSRKWKKYNAIAAFFNALIDMPFFTFVEFIEQWRYFLKEKKEGIH